MKKPVLWMLGLLGLSACSAHDEHYYAVHPKALQSAMEQCPEHAPGALSCEQLKNITLRVNQLVDQLRVDQQGYGKKIIALQETRDEQVKMAHENPRQLELRQALKETEQHLEEHLAVVKWLASPGG